MAMIKEGRLAGLETCPFCGSDRLTATMSAGYGLLEEAYDLNVKCGKCGADVKFSPSVNELWMHNMLVERRPEYDPVEHWNARAKEEDAPKWIPAKDKLPDVGMTVLFCDIDGDIYVGHYATYHWWSVDDKVKSVVAWMPLPEPYKAKEETDET